MPERKMPSREFSPFIIVGDTILIDRGGGAGSWEVMSSKYKSEGSDKIELVLKRGSTAFKTMFNRETMHVSRRSHPVHQTIRAIRAPEKATFKPKPPPAEA